MQDINVAIEELKILQSIIKNQDSIFSKIRGWCVVVVTGISGGFLSEKIQLESAPYFAISVFIIFLFTWTEAVHRVAQMRAINRSGNVESYLRGELQYDGPQIKNTLSKPNLITDQLATFSNRRFVGFYLTVLFIPIIVGLWT